MQNSKRVVPDASILPLWRKSSYSGGESGACLEVSDAYATWRKSTHSGGNSGECLEVNDGCTAHVPVRDSKVPHGPAIVFDAPAWSSFVSAVKGDRF